MAVKLPEVKKKISNFLLGEDGQISKKAAVGIGLALAGLAAQTVEAAHSSSTTLTYVSNQLTGTHASYGY